jgi:hypothetical protein
MFHSASALPYLLFHRQYCIAAHKQPVDLHSCVQMYGHRGSSNVCSRSSLLCCWVVFVCCALDQPVPCCAVLQKPPAQGAIPAGQQQAGEQGNSKQGSSKQKQQRRVCVSESSRPPLKVLHLLDIMHSQL